MNSQSTSFHKKVGSRVPFILGTKPSIQNAQLLVSTGVPSLDQIIGGGLPIGTMILIEEDLYGNFAKLLFKYYLAEGMVSLHDILVASQDLNPVQMMEELPKPIEKDYSKDHHSFNSNDKMNIAWRYQNLPSVESEPDTTYGHYYDITQTMEAAQFSKVNVTYWSNCMVGIDSPDGNDPYESLLRCIQEQIDRGLFNTYDNPKKRNVLRIGIHSLGSPLWGSDSANLLPFLYHLRALLSSSYCVCLFTMPSYLIKKISIIQRCQHISDIAVRLESFAGSEKETNPIFKDYHGLFHINKLPSINSLCSPVPGSFDLAFKLRRKKFTIEILHLPPELQETTQREQDDDYSSVSLGCSSSRKNVIDF